MQLFLINLEKAKKIVVNINNWKKLSKIVTKGDFVLYQHPMYFGTKFANKYIPIFQKKGVKFVALIHDLESLRNLTTVTHTVPIHRLSVVWFLPGSYHLLM